MTAQSCAASDSIADDSLVIVEEPWPDDWYILEGEPDHPLGDPSPFTVGESSSDDADSLLDPRDEMLRKRKLGRANQFQKAHRTPRYGVPHKRLRDKTVPFCGLSDGVMATLLYFCLPIQVFHIIAMMFHEKMLEGDLVNLDCVEYFCGLGMVHKSLLALGFNVRGYDIAHGPDQDLNGNSGWLTALLWCLLIRSGTGLSWLGTVCSSWIAVCRASTRRSIANPRGDLRSGSVREGNRHAARSAIIVAVCYSRLVTWILEQPSSSLLPHHPAFVHLQQKAVDLGMRFLKVETYQGPFGADTLKPTMLLSSDLCIQALRKPHPGHAGAAPSTTCIKGVNAQGRKTFTGSATLKATQTYTKEFGEAVATMFSDRLELQKAMPNYIANDVPVSDPWEDADLDAAVTYMRCMPLISLRYQATRYQATGEPL